MNTTNQETTQQEICGTVKITKPTTLADIAQTLRVMGLYGSWRDSNFPHYLEGMIRQLNDMIYKHDVKPAVRPEEDYCTIMREYDARTFRIILEYQVWDAWISYVEMMVDETYPAKRREYSRIAFSLQGMRREYDKSAEWERYRKSEDALRKRIVDLETYFNLRKGD